MNIKFSASNIDVDIYFTRNDILKTIILGVAESDWLCFISLAHEGHEISFCMAADGKPLKAINKMVNKLLEVAVGDVEESMAAIFYDAWKTARKEFKGRLEWNTWNEQLANNEVPVLFDIVKSYMG